MKVARNDPCPCGSGRKYKQCCLQAAGPSPASLTWSRLRQLADGLPADLLRFVRQTYGDGLLHEAWREFLLGEGGPFSWESEHIAVFTSWFFYDWLPDPHDTAISADLVGGFPAGAAYLRAHRRLDPLLARYMAACCAAPFSFFDVTACTPGSGLALHDVLTGEDRDVIEHSASRSLRAGDVIYAKPVTVDDVTVLEACAPVALRPTDKAAILPLRARLRSRGRKVTAAIVADFDMELREVYLEAADRLLHPRPPTMQNTDGEPLELHRVTYDVTSPREAFEALRPMAADACGGEPTDDATYGDDGALVSARIPWLRRGNAAHPGWSNTVLGNVVVEGTTLVGEVNSANRARLFRSTVEGLLGEGARHRSTVVEPIEAALAAARERGGDDAAARRETAELRALPEVQEKLAEMMRAHYREWVRMEVPALGGRTPLQAMRSRDGREMVEALVREMELRGGDDLTLADPGIIAELRSTLAAAVPRPGGRRDRSPTG